MFRSGRNALGDVREWSGDLHGCSGVVGRPSRVSVSGRDALGDVRQWSGCPTGWPGVDGRPSGMFGNGR